MYDRSHYSVMLDDMPLQNTNSIIVITDVTENAPQLDVQTAMHPAGPGEICMRQERRSISVTIKLRIISSDYLFRKRIWREVNAWAMRGGWLRITDRPHQRLRVRLSTPLALPSTLKWTNELSMTFTSVGYPYWENEDTVTATAPSATSGSVSVFVASDIAPLLEATAVNKGSKPLTRLRIDTGGRFIALEGMNIPAGESVRLYYDDDHIFQLPIEHRTEDSFDELPLTLGRSSDVSFTADQPVSIKFSARGYYL